MVFNTMSFDEFMRRVDYTIGGALGISYLDLPDYDYLSLFRAGFTVVEAAKEAVTAAGLDAGTVEAIFASEDMQ